MILLFHSQHQKVKNKVQKLNEVKSYRWLMSRRLETSNPTYTILSSFFRGSEGGVTVVVVKNVIGVPSSNPGRDCLRFT